MNVRDNDKRQHDTQCHLTADKEFIDALSAYRDGNDQARHDANKPRHKPTLPRLDLPLQEPFAHNLSSESGNNGSQLARDEKSDGKEDRKGYKGVRLAAGS